MPSKQSDNDDVIAIEELVNEIKLNLRLKAAPPTIAGPPQSIHHPLLQAPISDVFLQQPKSLNHPPQQQLVIKKQRSRPSPYHIPCRSWSENSTVQSKQRSLQKTCKNDENQGIEDPYELLQSLLKNNSLVKEAPAVDALSEREAQLALRNEIENGNIDDFIDTDEFEWNNDYDNSERERSIQVPNKALARYLARSSSSDYDDFYPSDYRKRSMYRKRDASVFRERSRAPNQQRQQQQVLAEKFLKAIEEERQREEEEEYRKQLRNLWDRYQLEEGDIEKELFDNDVESDYPLNNDDINRKKKKSRQNAGDVEVAPSYWSDKRSMPMLPWLPASRKKRFPVTKRSPKVIAPETSEKVSQDLKGIFGALESEKTDDSDSKKKKRSSDDSHPLTAEHVEKNAMTMHEHNNMHAHEAQKRVKKRDISDPDDDDENDNENDEEKEEAGDDEVDSDDSTEDDSKKKKKKKRDTSSKNLEVVRNENVPEKKLALKKKSLQWSNIFGLDRKKKSLGLIFHPLEEVADKRRKRCDAGACDEQDYDEDDYEDEDFRRKKKKKRSREDKLDTMDRKLKTIENLIIEDTAKYYENHDANLSPGEGRVLRNRVAERLATAYSLAKMRKAIAHLKESMDMERNLEKNLLQGPQEDDDEDDKKKKAKRVAVKKEKVEFDNNGHEIDSPAKKTSGEPHKNDLAEGSEDDDKKKKKKRSQKKSDLDNLITEEEPMSEGYMGGRMASECPLLDGIEKKCRGIDIMSGDAQHYMLEACGAHQLCYLCGDSQLQCDYEYLNEAEQVCGRDLKCKISARQALSLLRDIGGSRLPPRECIRNPCLNMAIRAISY